MKKSIYAIICVLALGASAIAIGHSGRTNSDGCHNDYKNGTYHCH